MNTISTFYLSRMIGKKVIGGNGQSVGKIDDLVVDVSLSKPKVIAVKLKSGNNYNTVDISHMAISKDKGKYKLKCSNTEEVKVSKENTQYLVRHVLDKQLVDIDGRKLVKVSDIRLAVLSTGMHVIAVDAGMEGILRRVGIVKPVRSIFKFFGFNIPGKLISWDEVETIGMGNTGIKLLKEHSKLATMHPSDLADIIEDMDRKTQVEIFSSLDEEKAADVLEELETDAQINVLESLSVYKAADVLEKMPADEVADILDEMEKEKAEELLSEMENEASEEVRELMEYPDNTVGSLMSTDFISFREDMTVNDTIMELRRLKPESDSIYYLYVLDHKDALVATVSLRDIVISESDTRLHDIMNRTVVSVLDTDKIDSLAEMISKYSVLAIPVVDEKDKLQGVVVIDDIVYELMKRKRRKT